MAKKLVTFKFNTKQISAYGARVESQNNKALVNTMNILSKRGIKLTAQEIAEDTGAKQASIRSRIKETKASKFNIFFSWFIKGNRLSLIKPLVKRGGIKKRGGKRLGISFLSADKRRTITKEIQGGSKPFVVQVNRRIKKGDDSLTPGNKLAAYRPKGYKTKWVKMVGHSLAWLLRDDWKERIERYLLEELPDEYRKQLKREKRVR